MAAVVTQAPSADNNYYGYVEFTVDGTDYTGTYKSETIDYNKMSKTYTYKVRMYTTTNMAGTTMYNFDVHCSLNGHQMNFCCSRTKGSKLKLVSGAEEIIDYQTEIVKKHLQYNVK